MTTDERIAALVKSAPPLSPEQRAHLAGLFRTTDHTREAKAS